MTRVGPSIVLRSSNQTGSTKARYSGSICASVSAVSAAARSAVVSVTPAACAAAAACSARGIATARRRSSGLRRTLRLERARPSASREVGQATIRTGRSRSAATRRSTTTCCASFQPKYAASGWTAMSSFTTIVATPSKCARPRTAPSNDSATWPATRTVVAKPVGYISAGAGAKTTSTPACSASRRSASSTRGYAARSAGSSNWVGLTNTDSTTVSFSDAAADSSERCPSCRAPIVGTKPIVPVRAGRSAARRSATVRATIIGQCSRRAGSRQPARAWRPPVRRTGPGAAASAPRRPGDAPP